MGDGRVVLDLLAYPDDHFFTELTNVDRLRDSSAVRPNRVWGVGNVSLLEDWTDKARAIRYTMSTGQGTTVKGGVVASPGFLGSPFRTIFFSRHYIGWKYRNRLCGFRLSNPEPSIYGEEEWVFLLPGAAFRQAVDDCESIARLPFPISIRNSGNWSTR